jgi:hypothetical protein
VRTRENPLHTLLWRLGRLRRVLFVVADLTIALVLGIPSDAFPQGPSQAELGRDRERRCGAAIGCMPFTYGVALTWQDGWRPGQYDLTIAVDGTTHHCTLIAPGAVCTDSTIGVTRHRAVEECNLGGAGRVALVDSVRIPPEWGPRPLAVTAQEEQEFQRRIDQLPTCALPGASAPLANITLQRRIDDLRITVSKGGRVVGAGHYLPVYEMWKPLGADCDFACPRAKGDTLAIKP